LKILLDEDVPQTLTRALGTHDVSTVASMGWACLSNSQNGKMLENTVPITAQTHPKNPQKHQQTRMSSPRPRNSNKKKVLNMPSDPL
jgi:hypothetical protein